MEPYGFPTKPRKRKKTIETIEKQGKTSEKLLKKALTNPKNIPSVFQLGSQRSQDPYDEKKT